MKNPYKIVMIFLIIILFPSCMNNVKEPISKNFFALDTYIKITLYDKTSNEDFDEIFKLITKMENKLSNYIETSEISAINKADSPVTISKDSYNLLQKSLYYSDLSLGYFDITSGSLIDLWAIGTVNESVPSKNNLKKAISSCGYSNLILVENNQTAFLSKRNMKIDTGAIAKGFISDKIIETLVYNGHKKAIINLGGNIFVLGSKEINTPWNIGIQSPFENRNEYIGVLSLSNKSIVTSGIYERYFEVDGIIYHHILNPFTGYPIDNNLVSVTVVSDYSVDGDALSTVLFALGKDKGLALVDKLDGIDAIFITKEKKVFKSNGIDTDIPFEVTDSEYVLAN